MNYVIIKKITGDITPTYQQIYNKNNADHIKEQRKKYYHKNKDKLTEYNKIYQAKNRDKINEKHTCSCGGKFTPAHRARHFKSKIHLNYLYSMTI